MKILKLIISILIPLGGGFLIGLISNPTSNLFVPSIVFPIVWTILYILMGISSYLVSENGGDLKLYYLQLIINFIWPIIYFNFDLKILALFILLLLIYLVSKMIKQFKFYDNIASIIQIPYLLWLVFATILNIISI